MDYTLRQATTADLEYCFSLHCQTMRDYVEATWGWDEAWQRANFEQNYAPAAGTIIQVAGQDAGVLVTEDQPYAHFLALIEIAPPYQRRGLGTKILNDLQQAAEAAGKPLTLRVLRANEPARRLYARRGFTVTAEDEQRIYMVWEPKSPTQTKAQSDGA